MLTAEHVRLTMGRNPILDGVDLALKPGIFTAVVGPNGAGKSTLLKVLSGETRRFRGAVQLNGVALQRYTPQALSLRRAILPQHTVVNFPFTVEQIVEIGRYPHRAKGVNQAKVVAETLAHTGLNAMKDRAYQTLSGGEKQRVQMARAMAQLWSDFNESRFLLLDEPTSSLDLAQQHALLGLAKGLCRRQIGVMAVLHDLNLALQYADEILFLKSGAPVAYGPTQEVITKPIIEATYDHPVQVWQEGGQTVIVPQVLGSAYHSTAQHGKQPLPVGTPELVH